MTVSLPCCGFQVAITHLKNPANTDNIKIMELSAPIQVPSTRIPLLILLSPQPTEFTLTIINSLTKKGLATSHPTNRPAPGTCDQMMRVMFLSGAKTMKRPRRKGKIK